jgi:hypothetical protein
VCRPELLAEAARGPEAAAADGPLESRALGGSREQA